MKLFFPQDPEACAHSRPQLTRVPGPMSAWTGVACSRPVKEGPSAAPRGARGHHASGKRRTRLRRFACVTSNGVSDSPTKTLPERGRGDRRMTVTNVLRATELYPVKGLTGYILLCSNERQKLVLPLPDRPLRLAATGLDVTKTDHFYRHLIPLGVIASEGHCGGPGWFRQHLSRGIRRLRGEG